MPKDSRARTLAVRKVMEETGLPYNRAAHRLDRNTGAANAPTLTGQLSVTPFVLSCTVPADADRRELAQALADQFHTLRRESTGEEYEGRADVIVPARSWFPDPHLPGYAEALLLVHAWAVRPWDRQGEADAVVTDFYTVAKSWLIHRYPAVPAAAGHPGALPLGQKRANALAAGAEFTAHAASAHARLPEGWEEQIATRRSTRAFDMDRQGDLAGWTWDDQTAGAGVVDGVRLVPNVRGGAEKTTLAVDLPLPPHQPVDIDSGPPRPYRVVDESFQGWYRRSGDGLYDADLGHARGLETMAYEDLDAARGPLRPVVPPTAEESAAVRAALVGAGREAAATLLVAIFRLVEADARNRRTGGAKNWLTAGREGSHESASLDRLAWNVGADLSEKPKRYDAAAVAELVRVIEGWVSGPDRYVEVASNLAGLFSRAADGQGGWSAMADRELRTVDPLRGWLMSRAKDQIAEA
ncbi:hypothetical protein ACFQ7N_10180 [Streptomyces niveus]|uniref:hypothetical protein n=1 Tax=Streptomyces niveus TaxID=193462 RepID=UPI00368B2C0A